MKNIMFERDLLYPTQVPVEPGCVHVMVLHPDKEGEIPIVIEPKTTHAPLDYVEEIVGILQADVFDRIRIDVRKTGVLYFKAGEADDRYFRVLYKEKQGYTVVSATQDELPF